MARPSAGERDLVDSAPRAACFAALGDPGRLAIVDDLVASDRSPVDLARRHHLPPNLLAHHLGVLESAGLISRTVSAGDRRRRYVRLNHDVLTELMAFTAASNGCVGEGAVTDAERVVFVCSAASARSQLAAALWRERTGGSASAAGTDPADEVHPGAMAAGRRAGLDLRGAVPRNIAGVPTEEALVVTVCDRAHEELGDRNGWCHWSVPDPVAVGSAHAFDACVVELGVRISRLAGVA